MTNFAQNAEVRKGKDMNGTETKAFEVRRVIKAELPNLKFKVITIDFEDLARCSRLFVSSDEWGMTKGNHETFQKVKRICKSFGNVVVSW
jgi:hypothetical protein